MHPVTIFAFLIGVRRRRGRLRAFWRCGGRGRRVSGNKRWRAIVRGGGGETYAASLRGRGDRGRRRVSRWAGVRVRLPWWRRVARRPVRRDGGGLGRS